MPSLSVPPISESQFTVTTTAFPGSYFTKFSGLEDKSETQTYADGLDFRVYYLIGLSQLSAMTLEIPFSPTLHNGLILYKKQNPCSRFVTAITPVNCTGDSIQSSADTTLYLTGCQITDIKAYTVDRGSAKASTIEFSFVADDYYLG